jgi:hypothetical protein
MESVGALTRHPVGCLVNEAHLAIAEDLEPSTKGS